MKKIELIFLIIVTISSAVVSGRAQAGDGVVIDNFISRQAKRLGAEEYRDARKVMRGDVNGDGKADMVVLYSLEGFGGGNSYGQYLAVFLAKGNTFQYATSTSIGGKLRRDVELTSIKGKTIYLDTKEYVSSDAACCPSKAGKAKFVLAANRLKEIK